MNTHVFKTGIYAGLISGFLIGFIFGIILITNNALSLFSKAAPLVLIEMILLFTVIILPLGLLSGIIYGISKRFLPHTLNPVKACLSFICASLFGLHVYLYLTKLRQTGELSLNIILILLSSLVAAFVLFFVFYSIFTGIVLFFRKTKRIFIFSFLLIPPSFVLYELIVDYQTGGMNSRMMQFQSARHQETGLKVVIIGLDGMDPDILESCIDQGITPHIARLKREGVYARLKSFKPCRSPILWTTVATGRRMHEHGIDDFIKYRFPGISNLLYVPGADSFAGTFLRRAIFHFDFMFPSQTLTSEFRKAKTLWNILDEQGMSSGFVNWWYSWPSEHVNGFQVSDQFWLSKVESKNPGRLVFPENLEPLLEKLLIMPEDITKDQVKTLFACKDSDSFLERFRLGQRDALPAKPNKNFSIDDVLVYFKSLYSEDLSNALIFYSLYPQFTPELGALYLRGIDRASHFFLKYYMPEKYEIVDHDRAELLKHVIPEIYRFNDTVVGKILEMIDSETIIILLSDHGFRPVNTNNYMALCGAHEQAPDGVLVMWGPVIKSAVTLEKAALIDIAPTILHMLGLPAAKDMPGRILTQAFESSWLHEFVPMMIASYEGENGKPKKAEPDGRISPLDDTIKKELRSLGYIQ